MKTAVDLCIVQEALVESVASHHQVPNHLHQQLVHLAVWVEFDMCLFEHLLLESYRHDV